MKHLRLYHIVIGYLPLYIVSILATGVWLFLLSHDFLVESTLKAMSFHRFSEIATAHLFAMSVSIFVTAHFMLFAQRVSKKLTLMVSVPLFVFALLDILVYIPFVLGVEWTIWVKLAVSVGFVLWFVVLLVMVAISLRRFDL